MLAMNYRGSYRIPTVEKPMPEILHPQRSDQKAATAIMVGTVLLAITRKKNRP